MSENKDPSSLVNYLVITANVGSLFEDLDGIQDVWVEQLCKVVAQQQPKFIALHCQELGGKKYKSSLEPVKQFFNKLMKCKDFSEFSTVRGFLDGDFDNMEQYTALGNIYFIHSSLKEAKLFNYKDNVFSETKGKEVVYQGLAQVPHIRKEKFAQDFFPGCRWSRKGYIRVRWEIHGKELEFVNVHLFHDDNNLVSIKSSPSPYTAYRKRALNFVTRRLQEEHRTDDQLMFMCGDFNFRLDVKALVQKICPTSRQQVVRAPTDGDEIIRVLFRNNQSSSEVIDVKTENDVLVKIEKKVFEVEQKLLQEKFCYKYLKPFDTELHASNEDMKEYEITFPPTYPLSENITTSEDYMRTRCPAWCDRVLMSPQTWDWIHTDNKLEVKYSTVGGDVCMGDHKPVYLAFTATHTIDSSHQEPQPSLSNGSDSLPP
uniref:inositol-polyphosphate 5-phosphatase n=1 Tax=Ciona savignyi TaxID=51511 RepID=H2Y7Z0_CIOSA